MPNSPRASYTPRPLVPAPTPDHSSERSGYESPDCGIVLYPPGATLGPRTQLDYQLVLIHTGWAEVTVDSVAREIPTGHVALLLPGHVEVFAFARQCETRHSWIAVQPGHLEEDVRVALDTATPLLPLSWPLQTCVELARYTADLQDSAGRAALRALGRAALALYIAEAAHIHAGRDALPVAVARARLIARQRAREGMGVRDLAREVGVSAEHLVRLVHHHLGITPGAMLREERLVYATHLLTRTGLSVAEVARQSGFASPHHFARCFKEVTGATPTQLRAHAWAADQATPPLPHSIPPRE